MSEISLVLRNALKNPSYAPYCLRCDSWKKMRAVERFYWRCPCGAEHDERPNAAAATEGRPESVDLAVDKGARTAQRPTSRSSPDAVSPDPAIASLAALRPETPRSGA